MRQQTFHFDQPAPPELAQIAETTSLPPPQPKRLPPPLVRPDRQVTFDGLPHYEWPAPEHDRNIITVDRIREDIDGPSHRFVIRRGDTVEVFFGTNRTDICEVTGISHRNQEVRVSFRTGSEGIWVNVSCVYPTTEELPVADERAVPLSEVVANTNVEPPEGFSERDRVPTPATSSPRKSTYTLDDFREFRSRYDEGQVSWDEHQQSFERLLATKESFQADLVKNSNAKGLAALALKFGCLRAKQNSKADNAHSIFRQILLSYVVDGTVSYSLTTSFEEAVATKVRTITVEDLMEARQTHELEAKSRQQALHDPKSFLDFRTFILKRGEEALSDEQLARYDILHAEMTRERRQAEVKSTVQQFQSNELAGYEFLVKEGYHDKRQCPVWIVQLSSRVERATFDELNRKAKMLGGWYSSFKKNDAGFQFLEVGQAEQFVKLLSRDADRTNVLEARRERHELSASERLHVLANELAARADGTIERSEASLQNTARRADIQSGVRGRAYADQALARTMHSIAEALSRHEATFLDGIRHKTQLETLDMLLRVGLFTHLRHQPHPHAESGRQPNLLDVRYAKYPYPTIYRKHLESAVAHGQRTRGLKQITVQMAKRLRQDSAEYLTFQHNHDLKLLEAFAGKLKQSGYDTEVFGCALEKYQRLQRASITDIHELRAALREYLEHRAESRGDNPVRIAERELIGKDLPGFFPTPRAVIARMLELAELGADHSVLEPSCGKGDIVDAVKAEYPDVAIHAIEQNRTLAEVLSAKGHEVEFGDFLEHRAIYDRIVMNPPFEHGQDVEHVRHAHSLLKPGGRLVSVMSEGPLFRSDKRSEAFRDWLEEVGAETEPIPENAFAGAHAFRETSVRTRLVTIDRTA